MATSTAGRREWTALVVLCLPLLIVSMDVSVLFFAVPSIAAALEPTATQMLWIFDIYGFVLAGLLLTMGNVADRIGRRPALMITILLYSFGSALSATATGLWSLMFWRAVVGLGLGGEWSTGTVLVAESWPARHRAKAIGMMQSGFALGYMLAAALAALVLPRWGWRVLFLIGVLPALLTFLIRRHVREPEVWLKQERPASHCRAAC